MVRVLSHGINHMDIVSTNHDDTLFSVKVAVSKELSTKI
jgi:hypothetical protein